MAKILKVTKDDQTVHFVDLSNKKALQHQSNLRGKGREWKFEEVDESEAAKFKGYKDNNHVPGNHNAVSADVVAEKDAEIARLKKLLEATQSKPANTALNENANTTASGTAQSGSLSVNATDAIVHIAALQTVDEVNAYLTAEDNRKTVKDAAEKRIAELSKANG
jgi:hypothetical protein